MMAIFVPSDFLGPSFIIRVYPPLLSRYRRPISSLIFFTILGEKNRANNLLECKVPFLATEINFSTNRETSLALASLHLIFSFKMRALARALRRAWRWSGFRLSFLPFFLFLIFFRETSLSTTLHSLGHFLPFG